MEVMVLEIDTNKKRLSLGIKQCVDNPWENFAKKNPIGTVLKGSIQNITDFGIFVQVEEGLDGPIKTFLDLNKNTKVSNILNTALKNCTYRIFLSKILPWIIYTLLNA